MGFYSVKFSAFCEKPFRIIKLFILKNNIKVLRIMRGITQAELAEKAIIDGYLPQQMDELAVTKLVDEQIAAAGSPTMQDMGKIIGAVRAQAGPTADGTLIAKLVKERLQ